MSDRTTATPPDAAVREENTANSGQTRREGAARALPEDALIIVPARNVVLFPGMVFPLTVGRERSRAAVQEAVRLQRPLGVLLQSKPDVDEPGPDDLHWVGTTASVLRYITAPDGLHHAICKGISRFRVLQFMEGYPFTAARVQLIDAAEHVDADIEGRALTLKERAVEILRLLPQVPEEMVAALQGVEGSARLADFIAGLMDIAPEEKQALLETFDLKTRLDKLLELLSHRIEVLKSRAKSTSVRGRPSTRATASICCASRCAPSRRSSAKPTRVRRRSPSWSGRSTRRTCPRRSTSRHARSSSAWRACPRAPASTR